MSKDEARKTALARWRGKAEQALAAARRDHAAGDLDLAVSRVYYACFYATTAALLRMGLAFSSHAAVRASLHQHLIKPGLFPADLGTFYNQAFDDRQEADYAAVVAHDAQSVLHRIEQAERFVSQMGLLSVNS